MGCSQSKAPATPAARTARVESARESLDGRSWAAHASYELPPEDRRAGPPPSRPSAVGVCEHFRDAPTPTPAFGLGLPARDTPPGETSRLEFEDRGVVHADRAAALWRCPALLDAPPGSRVCSPWFTLPAPPRPRLRPRSSPTIPARASARVFARRGRLRVSSSTRSTGDSSGRRRTSPRSRVRCTSSVAETETIETETIETETGTETIETETGTNPGRSTSVSVLPSFAATSKDANDPRARAVSTRTWTSARGSTPIANDPKKKPTRPTTTPTTHRSPGPGTRPYATHSGSVAAPRDAPTSRTSRRRI